MLIINMNVNAGLFMKLLSFLMHVTTRFENGKVNRGLREKERRETNKEKLSYVCFSFF